MRPFVIDTKSILQSASFVLCARLKVQWGLLPLSHAAERQMPIRPTEKLSQAIPQGRAAAPHPPSAVLHPEPAGQRSYARL